MPRARFMKTTALDGPTPPHLPTPPGASAGEAAASPHQRLCWPVAGGLAVPLAAPLPALVLLVLAKVARCACRCCSRPSSIASAAPRPGRRRRARRGRRCPRQPPCWCCRCSCCWAMRLLRFAGTLFTELRDLVFARVTLRTVADFAERTFAHLLSLGPRFHVQRNTGALIRDVERGTAGIGFLLGAGLFTLRADAGGVRRRAGGDGGRATAPWLRSSSCSPSSSMPATRRLLTQRRELRQRARQRAGLARQRAAGRQPAQLRGGEDLRARGPRAPRATPRCCAAWVERSVQQPARAVGAAHRPERDHRGRRGAR